MAPPRRVRDEKLVLRGRSGPSGDRELTRRQEVDHWFQEPTQRRFQVSPDARTLAWVHPGHGELRLLRRDGTERGLAEVDDQDLRFSPDGRVLAAVCGRGHARRIERVDVRTLASRTWAELRLPLWIEFCREGLVVLHTHDHGHGLTLVPWDGPPRPLAQMGWITRFTAAKAGTRVVWFADEEVWSIDVADPGAPQKLGRLPGMVRNAEMSPDGRLVAFATARGLALVDGDRAPEVLHEDDAIHTVWFSRDGAELAWASGGRAAWQKGGVRRELAAPGGDIEAMRFVQAGAGLIVSRGREAVLWTPERDAAEVLAEADADHRLLGADLFEGGLVLWMGTSWETLPRGGHSQKG